MTTLETLAVEARAGNVSSAIELAASVALSWLHPAARLANDLYYRAGTEVTPEQRRAMSVLRCKLMQDDSPCFCGTHREVARV